ncbi:MAG: hypothetical protein ASARMPREDX12_003572 [Alectoria sarmentosa]|nr:MAG: hypothetical protein ASARMPREDX12_003572 [Alectoria sarmentosa]
MADICLPSPLQIPMVTQEDLHAFHARVFGSPAPGQLFRTDQEPYNDSAYQEVLEVEHDDLGYYLDGAKRTLTDDQIAMFRHSEIYSIVRERQVRKENLEAEGGEQSEAIVSRLEEAVEGTALCGEEEELQSDGEVKEVSAAVLDSTPQYVEVTHATKKRKRGETDTGYVHGKKYASRSARGFVRELDSAAAEDQVLDYGDEPSAVEVPRQLEDHTTQVTRSNQESQARAIEGKKIWWPIIEET